MAKKTAPLLRLGASSGMRQPTLVTALGVSKNGKFAVTGDSQGVARLFDVSVGTCVTQVELPKKRLRPGQREILAASISNDGRMVCLQVRQDSSCWRALRHRSVSDRSRRKRLHGFPLVVVARVLVRLDASGSAVRSRSPSSAHSPLR